MEPVERQVKFGTARLAPAPYRPTAWMLTVDGALQSYVDLAEAGLLLGERGGNVVLAASDRDLPHQALTAWGETPGNRVFCLSPTQLAAIRGEAPPLTAENPADAIAPVPRWLR
ncbi:hypothetical protein ACQPW3_14240 [Actinosynnema sp. CA-248983]